MGQCKEVEEPFRHMTHKINLEKIEGAIVCSKRYDIFRKMSRLNIIRV
jgi:hypothetical protein